MTNRLTQIEIIQEMLKTQGENLDSPYMIGMYNGLELALAVLEDRRPKFRIPENSDDAKEAI